MLATCSGTRSADVSCCVWRLPSSATTVSYVQWCYRVWRGAMCAVVVTSSRGWSSRIKWLLWTEHHSVAIRWPNRSLGSGHARLMALPAGCVTGLAAVLCWWNDAQSVTIGNGATNKDQWMCEHNHVLWWPCGFLRTVAGGHATSAVGWGWRWRCHQGRRSAEWEGASATVVDDWRGGTQQWRYESFFFIK